jgi:PAS domain-containing protein
MSGNQCNIIYVNQTWIDWTGKPFEAHLGGGWTKAIIDEDREQAVKSFGQAFEKRKFLKRIFEYSEKMAKYGGATLREVLTTVWKDNLKATPGPVLISPIEKWLKRNWKARTYLSGPSLTIRFRVF